MPFAQINGATAAQFTVVAASAGKKVRVVFALWSAAGAQTFQWQSNNNALTPAMTMSTGQPFFMGPLTDGVLETNTGEALNFTLTAAQQVSGVILYVTEPQA